MNLAQCQSAPGQWLMMKGTARRYNLQSGQYGPYAVGTLEDQTGQQADMLFGNSDKSPLPQQSLLNISCIYNVQWDANKQKYKAYFKSFSQEQQQIPYQEQRTQAPQQPPQPPPTQDNRNTSIERQCVIKAVAEIMAARPDMTVFDGMGIAVTFHDWIATGRVIDSSPDFPDDEPPT